ncbi:uncharacterized protein Osi2 [Halyomorpha halys]|uniref:uncharacterized protein Osi2 n=1 Tax=Halyomorpha halys TaxID=286706 RepID=UPI000D0C7C32|nr:uncharacterized protein LOC106689274 [Halyomorpha halys]
MGWSLLLPIIVLCCNIYSSNGYDNVTVDYTSSKSSSQWETEGSCSAGEWGSCLEGGVLASFSAILGKEYRLSQAARIVRSNVPSVEQRSQGGFFSKLAKAGDDFVRSAGLEIELTPELTENGRFQPRFIDEIYTELDTLQLKNAKPSKQYELKKLFIPLLVLLKLFKLKLFLLLPVILGVASFKKLLGIAFFALPAIIAYFKVCKPDLGHGYGSYGHSSFYNAPPSLHEHRYTEDGTAYDRMSYRDLPNPQNLAYNAYYHQ